MKYIKSIIKKENMETMWCSIALIIFIVYCLIINPIFSINKIKELEKIKDEKIVVECKTHGQIMEGDIICYRNFEEEINASKRGINVLLLVGILLLIGVILMLKNEIHKIKKNK
jgi:hypothetical protein